MYAVRYTADTDAPSAASVTAIMPPKCIFMKIYVNLWWVKAHQKTQLFIAVYLEYC